MKHQMWFDFDPLELEFGSTLVRFKGGGGSAGGGGGSSGRIDYPDYMKTVHGNWLDTGGTDTIEKSMTEVMDSALGASPWAGEIAYDPDTPLSDAWTAICAYNTVVDALNNSTDWISAIGNVRTEIDDNLIDPDFVSNALIEFMQDMGLLVLDAKILIDSVIDDTFIKADTDAFSFSMDDQVDNVTLSKFRAGMRDINAVQSSAFVLGEALILGMKGRDVAQHESGQRVELNKQRNEMIMSIVDKTIDASKLGVTLRMDRNNIIVNAADQVVKSLLARVEFEKAVAALSVEAKRIHIVAKKEEQSENWAVLENDAKWDLEVFQYGANLLASIGGGTATYDQKQPSTVQSAIGGALSGAAMGASVGAMAGGMAIPGAIIGGLLGLGAALFS